ncbi:hypothetical protein CCH79_00010665 [Gambusia affinis]|uniref:Uncharacterized protein n=1 Tax=Gambusia affinis TaxID=33528 RepID=A0A315WJT9_GAMAF|nr:hypothetical protein CCH79_00010665 [Gambusia affinis]
MEFENIVYPRIVRKFKCHLENPIPQEPTKAKRFFSSVRAKIKTTFFDNENLYSEENCLSEGFSESTDPNGTEPVQDGTDKRLSRGTEAERERMMLGVFKLHGPKKQPLTPIKSLVLTQCFSAYLSSPIMRPLKAGWSLRSDLLCPDAEHAAGASGASCQRCSHMG